MVNKNDVLKGLVKRNAHVKYEIPISSGSEVMGKVKVFVHIDTDGCWPRGYDKFELSRH